MINDDDEMGKWHREEATTASTLLAALIDEAEKKGLWLRSKYQGMCYSPSELRERNAMGELRWGPVNWDLINPKTLLRDPESARLEIEKQNREIERRISSHEKAKQR